MHKPSVLVVDDDPSIRKFIRANLETWDYQVCLAADGEEALQVLESELPDLIILDIMMPNLDGFEVCRRVREWSSVPIIMLSAREGETDKVKCLDIGADDYLTKPFSLQELLSRIKAVLRRTQTDEKEGQKARFQNNALIVDFAQHTVSLAGENVKLTGTEYKLISYLAANAGRILTYDQILNRIWGEEYLGDEHILQVNIARLKKKLEINQAGSYIENRTGIGYTLKKPAEGAKQRDRMSLGAPNSDNR